jgi:hypothetical protein
MKMFSNRNILTEYDLFLNIEILLNNDKIEKILLLFDNIEVFDLKNFS